MTNIQVYEPALCCSSGVCGTEIDEVLITFSSDVEWVKRNGASIERFNLAQEPLVFADNALVRAALEAAGQECLPLILANGAQVLSGRYPSREELAGWMNTKPAKPLVLLTAFAAHSPCRKPARTQSRPATAAGNHTGTCK